MKSIHNGLWSMEFLEGIVPTLSNLLQISLPSGANGKIISEALKK